MEVDGEHDKLNIQRIAGGSVVNYPPAFSIDGEYVLIFYSSLRISNMRILNFRILFVIWDDVVRAYSTQTGEWIRDLEGANADIIGVQCVAEYPKLVFACTVTGQVISWKWKSGVVNVDRVNSLKKIATDNFLHFCFSLNSGYCLSFK